MQGKKRIELVIFSVISLFLIAGCGRGDDLSSLKSSPFLQGSQGLEIEFLQGNPPDAVTDNGNFPFKAIVSVINQGEFDLEDTQVEISLSGFFPGDFGVTEADKGKLKDQNPDGDPTARKKDSEGNIIEPVEVSKTFPTIGTDFNYGGTLPGNRDFLFRTEACYRYRTVAVSEICVLRNMVDVTDDAPCDPGGSKKVFSSASPIGVTSFRQSVVGTHKIQFSFDIVHQGGGDVFIVDQNLDAARTFVDLALIELDKGSSGVAAAKNFIDDPDDDKDDAIKRLGLVTFADPDLKTILDEVIAEVGSALTELNSNDVNGAKTELNKVRPAKIDGLIVYCPKSPSTRRAKEDKVIVTVDTGITSGALSCVGIGQSPNQGRVAKSVNLVGGKRTVTCTQVTPNNDFIQPVDITVDFNYLDSTDKEVLVKHLG